MKDVLINLISKLKKPKEQYSTKYIQLGLSIICLLLYLTFGFSREMLVSHSDDLIRYYETYLRSDYMSFYSYIQIENREPLFQAYNYMLYSLLGEIPPRYYLVFMIWITGLFHFISMVRANALTNSSAIYGWVLLLPPVIMYDTQLIRQGMSISLLCSGILFGNRKAGTLLIVSSFFVHATSFFVYIAFFSLKAIFNVTSDRILFFILPLVFISPFIFISIFDLSYDYLSSIEFISRKISFLTSLNYNLRISPLYFFSLIYSFVFLIFYRKFNENYFYLLLATLTLCAYISFPFPLLSQRFMVYSLFFLPIVIYKVNELAFKRHQIISGVVSFLLLGLVSLRYITVDSGFSLFNGYFNL